MSLPASTAGVSGTTEQAAAAIPGDADGIYASEDGQANYYYRSGLKVPNADDVQKITIIPRGQAGGYTLMMPKEETYLATKTELLQRITGLEDIKRSYAWLKSNF